MKFCFALTLLLTCFIAQAQVSPNCAPPAANENVLTKGDYTAVLKNEDEAKTSYDATYEDVRRLEKRAYWSSEQNAFVFQRSGRVYKLPEVFVKSLSRHVEIALDRSYAEYIYYPDMGHAHLLIPKDQDPMLENPDEGYQKLIGDQNLKFLYHTAELFLMREGVTGPLLGDFWWKWRYYSRNLVGDNQGGDDLHIVVAKTEGYNTVRELPNHVERARVYISANQNGCFSFQQNGRTVNYDLRLE